MKKEVTTKEIIKKNRKARRTDSEKEAIEYEKFKNKVNRLTEYAHSKRVFARMEASKTKEEESRKAKKGAVVKTETTS